MKSYLAFLRGINVGGKNIIKMEHLRKILTNAGLKDVKTYIQSGNLFFRHQSEDVVLLKSKIENELQKQTGMATITVIRKYDEIEKLVTANPFSKIASDEDVKLYVCFLDQEPPMIPNLPLELPAEAVKLIDVKDKNAFVVSYPLKGRYGFPSNFIEKELKTASTARNWNTIKRIVGKK